MELHKVSYATYVANIRVIATHAFRLCRKWNAYRHWSDDGLGLLPNYNLVDKRMYGGNVSTILAEHIIAVCSLYYTSVFLELQNVAQLDIFGCADRNLESIASDTNRRIDVSKIIVTV